MMQRCRFAGILTRDSTRHSDNRGDKNVYPFRTEAGRDLL